MRAKVTSPLGLQLSADECPAVMGVVLGADAEFDLPHRSCAFLGSMMISTTLRRSAIHAAHHLPDLELGPRAPRRRRIRILGHKKRSYLTSVNQDQCAC